MSHFLKNWLIAITYVKSRSSTRHGESIWWEAIPQFPLPMTSVLVITKPKLQIFPVTCSSSPQHCSHLRIQTILTPLLLITSALPLDSRRKVTLLGKSCDPAKLYSCHPCWYADSEFLNDRERLFPLQCSAQCLIQILGNYLLNKK